MTEPNKRNSAAPNLADFLKYMEKNSDKKLLPHQIELAESLINYRVKHFAGGRQSGRTVVVQAVQSYFSSEYPDNAKAGKEI